MEIQTAVSLPANLPDYESAKLPTVYRAAVKALSACSRIDECQEWADKAEALASYAKQARDESMRKMADRIQARAIRRCGELLKQVGDDRGGRPAENPDGTVTVSRAQAAAEAGLSERQKVTALRVANVPAADFEALMDADDPPTVTALAAQGTRRLTAEVEGPNPLLLKFKKLAHFVGETDAASLAASVPESQRGEFRALIGEVDAWLDQFITTL